MIRRALTAETARRAHEAHLRRMHVCIYCEEQRAMADDELCADCWACRACAP